MASANTQTLYVLYILMGIVSLMLIVILLRARSRGKRLQAEIDKMHDDNSRKL